MRKYEIRIIPKKPVDFAAICRTEIGKGGYFCVQKDCGIKHKGELFSIQPKDIFVAKFNHRIGFTKPILSRGMVGSMTLSSMLTGPLTLNKWHR